MRIHEFDNVLVVKKIAARDIGAGEKVIKFGVTSGSGKGVK